METPEVISHNAAPISDDDFDILVEQVTTELYTKRREVVALAATVVYNDGEASNVALGDLELLHGLQLDQLTALKSTLEAMPAKHNNPSA
jgi:hypothetical protein